MTAGAASLLLPAFWQGFQVVVACLGTAGGALAAICTVGLGGAAIGGCLISSGGAFGATFPCGVLNSGGGSSQVVTLLIQAWASCLVLKKPV